MAEMDRLIADPTAFLSVPSTDLLQHINEKQIQERIKHHYSSDKPDTAGYIAGILGGLFKQEGFGESAGRTLSYESQRHRYRQECNETRKLFDQFVLSIPVLPFREQDKHFFRSMASLVANGIYGPDQWARYHAMFVFNGGECLFECLDTAHPKRMVAAELLLDLFKALLDVNGWRQRVIADVETHRKKLAASSPASPAIPIPSVTDQSAHWMTYAELQSSPYYDLTASAASVLIGYEPQFDRPVYFSGNESLMTVAGPGAGKSQTQVMPNLFRYPGSAIVLDIKGELWDATAGWRAKTFGPVYRFAPTDPARRTHRYNPFDFVSTDPDIAANDASVFSYQVMVENPNLHDPYWENRGRDVLWAFALYLAMKAQGATRGIGGLAELVNLPLVKDPKADIHQITASMTRLSGRINIPDLAGAANAIKSGIGTPRLESVIDTARRTLSAFTRAPTVMNAISVSDWRPETFRKHPGSTLYICLDADELKAYAPLVRLILAQHARILQKHLAKPGEPPITFFLDEMPQLGNFEALQQLQAIGRGAGLRLWMFSQTIGQLANAFGKDRYMGVIDACRVRCFMQPEQETARILEEALGETTNYAGEKRPLATMPELMGRAYGNKIITTTRGDLPMTLGKRFAWKSDPDKMVKPPHLTPLP